MPPFKYTFRLSPDDMASVNRTGFRPGRWMRISAMIVLPLAVLMTALWFRNWIDSDELLAAYTALVAIPVYIIGLLAVKFLYLLPRKSRRIFRQNRALQEQITVELSEETFVVTTLYGSSSIPWDHFHACRVNKRVIALFVSQAQCHVLPSRIFASAEERHEVLALMVRKFDRRSRSGEGS
jgi:hypothetical protein